MTIFLNVLYFIAIGLLVYTFKDSFSTESLACFIIAIGIHRSLHIYEWIKVREETFAFFYQFVKARDSEQSENHKERSKDIHNDT